MVRLGLLATGSYLLFTCSDVWYRVEPANTPTWLTLLATWFCLLSGLFVCGSALGSRVPRRWQVPALVLVLLGQWLNHGVYAQSQALNQAVSDTVLLSVEAATLFLIGENPYSYTMADMYSVYESTARAMTPHLDGHSVDILPYPPLHFLSLVPFVGMGLEGARLFYNLCYSGLLVLLFSQAKPAYRNLILLPLLVNPEFARYPLSWSSDVTWALLVGLMMWRWSHPLVRAVLFGLACSYKQTPWLFALFLVVRLVKEENWKQAWRFSLLSFGVFCLFNIPFALADLSAWTRGTFDPMLSPMIPYGRGYSLLTQTHFLSFPREYYSLVTLIVMLGLVWFYWHNYSRFRRLLWLFPAIFLFFSFRSLQHYFIYSIPLLCLEWSLSSETSSEGGAQALKWSPLAAMLTGFAMSTLWYWPGPAKAKLDIVSTGPSPYRLQEAEVRVTNLGEEALRPRFFGRTIWHAYPWDIRSGKELLEPGESGLYQLSTDLRYRALSKRHGGEFLLSDATSKNRYYARASVPKEKALSQPRVVESPPTAYWEPKGHIEFQSEQILFQAGPSSIGASLARPMTLPESPIEVTVKIPFEMSPSRSFGLTLQGQKMGPKVSVYFGPKPGHGFHTPNHYFKVLPTPVDVWTTHKIDGKRLFGEAGFPLPELTRHVSQDVELLARPIYLTFALMTQDEAISAQLKVVKIEPWPALGRLVQNVNRKNEYLAFLGDLAVRERNFDLARDYYIQTEGLETRRQVDPADSFRLALFDLELRPQHRNSTKLRLFVDPKRSLTFHWSPKTACQIRYLDQVLTLQDGATWQPPEVGILEIELEAESPAHLQKITVHKP